MSTDRKLNLMLEDKIVSYYLTRPMTLSELNLAFPDLCVPTLVKALNKHNIPRYSKEKIYNPNVMEDYFEIIDSEEKAYFLGLMLTDGNVFYRGDNKPSQMSLCLMDSDSYMLEKFKCALNTSTNITSDGRGASMLAVRNNKLCEDLAKFGVVPNKSNISRFPDNIPYEYLNHFIRGIFDGDGSMQFRLKSPTRRKIAKSIGFSSGNPTFLYDLKRVMIREMPTLTDVSVYEYSNKKTCMLTWASVKDVFTIGNYIYNNSTIYLRRKRALFCKFSQYYRERENVETISNYVDTEVT